MENFTPLTATAGGILIGLSATAMLWLSGRITGISGILAGALSSNSQESLWRWLFIAGLACGALLYAMLSGQPLQIEPQASTLATVLAGLAVGFGTRLGSGCTSGHGICGIARISARSIVATLVFIACGMITVFLTR